MANVLGLIEILGFYALIVSAYIGYYVIKDGREAHKHGMTVEQYFKAGGFKNG